MMETLLKKQKTLSLKQMNNCFGGKTIRVYYYDHYYTRIQSSGSGYTDQGIQCYVYPTQVAGTVPLKQYYNSSRRDHFYCTNPSSELLSGYNYNGDCCYVYPGTR